jgi:hypothetical protein
MSYRKYFLVLTYIISFSAIANSYYINSETGNNNNDGSSPTSAWKTLDRVSQVHFKAGDQILLATGLEYFGSLVLKSQKGTLKRPILISSYKYNNSEKQPHINATGYLNGILIIDSSHITVRGLSISANGGNENPIKGMRCGILYKSETTGDYKNIIIENCIVRNIFFENPGFQRGEKEIKTANGTQNYGWGIRFLVKKSATLKKITIQNNTIENVAHTGIKINGSIRDLKLINNTVYKTGGPGVQMSGIVNGHVKENTINYSGSKDDSRKWGRGSGLWTWGCDKILIEHNRFKNANGPADSAGCHIDFNCSNIVIQYNVSEKNAGGFCEILGNNYNCAYRYNVSINDGHRVKRKGIAFQEGKIFWLSGFVGKKRKRHGPYNTYFYNNTIYVKSEIEAKFAVSKVASGALLANNIFYIEGDSKAVLGDQYQPQEEGGATLKNIVFKNNVYLKSDNWPEAVLIQDTDPIYGNPKFSNLGGSKIKDYIPTNHHLIKNKGISIPNIPEDKRGLFIGLNVKKDILGNRIKGLPDLGAIELQ